MLKTTKARMKFYALTFRKNFWSDLDKEKEIRQKYLKILERNLTKLGRKK